MLHSKESRKSLSLSRHQSSVNEDQIPSSPSSRPPPPHSCSVFFSRYAPFLSSTFSNSPEPKRKLDSLSNKVQHSKIPRLVDATPSASPNASTTPPNAKTTPPRVPSRNTADTKEIYRYPTFQTTIPSTDAKTAKITALELPSKRAAGILKEPATSKNSKRKRQHPSRSSADSPKPSNLRHVHFPEPATSRGTSRMDGMQPTDSAYDDMKHFIDSVLHETNQPRSSTSIAGDDDKHRGEDNDGPGTTIESASSAPPAPGTTTTTTPALTFTQELSNIYADATSLYHTYSDATHSTTHQSPADAIHRRKQLNRDILLLRERLHSAADAAQSSYHEWFRAKAAEKNAYERDPKVVAERQRKRERDKREKRSKEEIDSLFGSWKPTQMANRGEVKVLLERAGKMNAVQKLMDSQQSMRKTESESELRLDDGPNACLDHNSQTVTRAEFDVDVFFAPTTTDVAADVAAEWMPAPDLSVPLMSSGLQERLWAPCPGLQLCGCAAWHLVDGQGLTAKAEARLEAVRR